MDFPSAIIQWDLGSAQLVPAPFWGSGALLLGILAVKDASKSRVAKNRVETLKNVAIAALQGVAAAYFLWLASETPTLGTHTFHVWMEV